MARRREWIWPAAAAVLSMVPFAGAFSNSRIFYVRDLALYFWPRHQWLRQTWRAGDWPWWDPFAGAGQSAVADALNQFFLLPVVVFRLLAPDVIGFNLWVALPFPVAAVGAWCWLRRHASPPAAFVGATALAASGPMLSTGNFPNLSWSAAFVPWTIWAAERVGEGPFWRRAAVLALAVALQALSGEPVSLAATCALVVAYPLLATEAAGWRPRLARAGRVASGIVLGGVLAAVQLVPLAVAASGSPRTLRTGDGFWSLHPLGLLETLLPHLFGHAYTAATVTFPWMRAINSNREPLFYSLYVGVGLLALALVRPVGADERRRWRLFWWGAALVALLCAAGEYTPAYGWLTAVVPPLRSLRFPVKYTLFVPVALAVLATAGTHALIAHARGQAALRRPDAAIGVLTALTIAAVTLTAVNLAAPALASSAYEALAAAVNVDEPTEAAKWMLNPLTPLLTRLAALSFSAVILVYAAWSRRRGALPAATLLGALAVVDPLVTNFDLNPTIPASTFREPRVVAIARRHPEDRIYIGGRLPYPSTDSQAVAHERLGTAQSIDGPVEVQLSAARPYTEALSWLASQYVFSPAPLGVRQIISYDLPELWPREYWYMLRRFMRHPFADRIRFLQRTGVRYCVMSRPPHEGATPLLSLAPDFVGFYVYECGTDPKRLYITTEARVVPDLKRQIDMMFEAAHDPFATVLLEREPPAPAGRRGTAPDIVSASIVSERNTELVVKALVGAKGGYLNVVDSYHPYWRVTVDGESAPLLRANAIFRAVRLAPGTHEVRFEYRPKSLYAGAALSGLTALLLLGGCLVERRRPAVRNASPAQLVNEALAVGDR